MTRLAKRQQLRRGLLIASFALFPVTLNYFSPYLIVESSAQGIVNGSLLVFGAAMLSVHRRGVCLVSRSSLRVLRVHFC